MRYIAIIAVSLFYSLLSSLAAHADEIKPIIIGLDADMSAGSAKSGTAIKRGALLAIHEINAAGGVLNRPLKLKVMDHRGNPARGNDNIESFASKKNVVAVLGGLHTPVALHELKAIHKHRMIYLAPWAAGTPIIDNGYMPNFAFRLSVRDQYAGGFLVQEAKKRGYLKVGLLLERTGWGASNERAMKKAIKSHGLSLAGVEWFLWGAKDLEEQINTLSNAKADVILMVANAPEGATIVKTMAKRPTEKRLPIISHWGITGGDFPRLVGNDLQKVDLSFLQTYSFFKPTRKDYAEKVMTAYCKHFSACQVKDIIAPVGTAHAYDLMHILALGIKKAGTTDREKVREALEHVQDYSGLLRHYKQPFTSKRHDALGPEDFSLGRYAEDGSIRPVVR